MFTAMIAEPALTSAGGGGHFMTYTGNGTPILYDFFVDMPSGKIQDVNLDFFSIDVDFGTEKQSFQIGKGAVAVPGAVAGLLHVQKLLGKLPLKEILVPAIRAAKEGVILSDIQAYLLTVLKPILLHSEKSRQIYAPQGELLKGGERIVMSQFSDFLDALSHEGVDLMYKGEVSTIIADWAKEGGLIVKSDLENFVVKERKPLKTNYCNHEVFLNPPPALSGILIDVTLSLLETRSNAKTTSPTINDLVTACDITNQLRQEELPDGMVIGLTPPTQQKSFLSYVERFTQKMVGRSDLQTPFSRGATTHISILDKEGNGASVTTTNGEGCGYILPEAGFMLNNMLGEEDLNPGGFHSLKPGARLPSMVAPTIVLKGKEPVLLTGSAGSNRIRSVIVQLIVSVLSKGMFIEDSTRAPRLHLEGNVLHLEPGVSEIELKELEKWYVVRRWEKQNVFFGGANSVTKERGTGDPRRGGYSIIC